MYQLQQQPQQAGGTKLEKAELLEMTVAYVWRVQKNISQQMSLGFASCMREVEEFLAQTGTGSEVDAQLRAHLVRRLLRCRRHLGSAIFADQTASRRRDEDQPSSSSTLTSGLPRKLCFDDRQQARSALRDMNDNARYTQLACGDFYRRSTTLTTGSENIDFLCGQQLDTATVGVDSISSTTSTSAQQSTSAEHIEGPSYSRPSRDVENHVSAFDYSSEVNVADVKDEELTPVWRPW